MSPIILRPWTSAAIRSKTLLGFLLLGFLVTGGWWFYRQLLPVAPPGAPAVRVEIPPGSSSGEITALLTRKALIRSALAFQLYLHGKGLDKKLQAGEYLLSPSLSPPEIAERLVRGRVVLHRVTIPEGFTLKQIAARLSEAGLIDEERFWRVVAQAPLAYPFLNGAPPGKQRLEGFLFPDTYYFPKGTSEEKIIETMLQRFQEAYTPAMEARAAELGLTTKEVVTLASLVERETKLAHERPLVAAVFHNRLRQGLKLESCATVQYLLDKPKAVLLEADLKLPSPYNTYLHPGLPPGPIGSPGLASLEAALHPAPVPYLYFVANPDGSHTFSRTLREHLTASRRARDPHRAHLTPD